MKGWMDGYNEVSNNPQKQPLQKLNVSVLYRKE